MDAEAIKLQIQILTAFVGGLALLVGAGLAYLRLYTGNAISTVTTALKDKLKEDFEQSHNKLKDEFEASNDKLLIEIKQEFARKEIIDEKLAGLERRVARTEARTDALAIPRTINEHTK